MTTGQVDAAPGGGPVPTVRVGLVGTGLMAKVRSAAYALLPVYYPAPAVAARRSVVCDLDPVTAGDGARRLGWADAAADYEELVRREDVDLVDITTPNHLHADVAVAAARAGKMIVCEKPLASDLTGARRMYEAATAAGVRTAVTFQKRRIPAIAHAHALVRAGAVGDLLFFHGTYRQHFGLLPLPAGNWRADADQVGSMLAEVGSHVVDLARFLVGEFHCVAAMSDGATLRGSAAQDSTVVWSATLGQGVIGSFEVCTKASGEGDGLGFELYGTRGSLRWHARDPHVLAVSAEAGPQAERGTTSIRMSAPHPGGEIFHVLTQEGLVDVKAFEIHDILEAFAHGAPYHPDFEDGLRVAEVVDAVLRSARSGARVDLPAPS